MLPTLVMRTMRTANFRCIRKFAWNFGVKGLVSVERFKRRIKRRVLSAFPLHLDH
jgi:hypothetical protein